MNRPENRLPKPAPNLRGLAGYSVPSAPAPTDLKLDSNECLPPPLRLEQIAAQFDPFRVSHYVGCGELEKAIADELGITPRRVLVTAGADEAIDRACRVYLQPDRKIIIPMPTFSMFANFARMTGGQVVPVHWGEGEFPTDSVLSAVTEQTGMVVVISPNNPTGLTIKADELKKLSASAQQVLILLDLAYSPFADIDLMQMALELPNVLVVQTFSKAWGLAGLRVGFAAGAEEVISLLRVVGGPYPVASLSLYIAQRWLVEGKNHFKDVVTQVRNERARLREQLIKFGINTLPSQGNFVFSRFTNPIWVRDAMAGLGIAVRYIAADSGFAEGLRFTCPGEEQAYRRLSAALETVLAPQAMLFDMDGVLADVEQSYRTAIVAAAQTYGVNVTAADIASAKAEGDANDDWRLTQKLLARNGVNADLDEVTERFELLYQGNAQTPGLREKETLLPPVDLLKRLAKRMPLGIVTGRPRIDAERFLAKTGVDDLFTVVITREDGPLKPDPAPVRLALQSLGVEHAWMLGDTPDDMSAAKQAGVLPIGYLSSAAWDEASVNALHKSGAARVLKIFEQLEELLP